MSDFLLLKAEGCCFFLHINLDSGLDLNMKYDLISPQSMLLKHSCRVGTCQNLDHGRMFPTNCHGNVGKITCWKHRETFNIKAPGAKTSSFITVLHVQGTLADLFMKEISLCSFFKGPNPQRSVVCY